MRHAAKVGFERFAQGLRAGGVESRERVEHGTTRPAHARHRVEQSAAHGRLGVPPLSREPRPNRRLARARLGLMGAGCFLPNGRYRREGPRAGACVSRFGHAHVFGAREGLGRGDRHPAPHERRAEECGSEVRKDQPFMSPDLFWRGEHRKQVRAVRSKSPLALVATVPKLIVNDARGEDRGWSHARGMVGRLITSSNAEARSYSPVSTASLIARRKASSLADGWAVDARSLSPRLLPPGEFPVARKACACLGRTARITVLYTVRLDDS